MAPFEEDDCDADADVDIDDVITDADEMRERGHMFADAGGRSALRAESPTNPRIYTCPNCGTPNALTQADVRLGYQCDGCADAAEGRF